MVAPLIFGLGLAGLAAAGAGGRTFLDDYLARRQNERQAGGFMAALDAARATFRQERYVVHALLESDHPMGHGPRCGCAPIADPSQY